MERFGVVILGASARSITVLDYLQRHPRDAFVVGIYDPVPQRSRLLIEHYGLSDTVVYGSQEEALGDGRAQAAFVLSVDCAHREGAVAAIEAGRHVFCEKPLATTLEDCDAIGEAAHRGQGVFYLGMNLRHTPLHETLREWVASGRLGRVLTIEANEHYAGGKTYFRRWGTDRVHR